MTMVSTGPISLGGNATSGGLNQSVNIELGRSATAAISMNEAAVRTLFGVGGSGTSISMSQGYGKSNQFAFTISSNQTNANLRTLAVNAGWNETSQVVATISGGVYLSSNSTGTPALTVSGSFPGGVTLINNGFIIGMGGAGGRGAYNTVAGGSGGTALSASSAITITNNGTIGGGGGGGQGAPASYLYDSKGSGSVKGPGGGGGRSSNFNSAAGANGDAVPGYGPFVYDPAYNATAGTVSAAGGGGSSSASYPQRVYGGTGGGWGEGGGGWSGTTISGWDVSYPAAAGGGGAAVSGNSNITWVATGTRLGAIT